MSNDAMRLSFLITCVIAVTLGHYATNLDVSVAHDLFRRLYYVPIIAGGCWYGLRGGLATAAVVSVLFAPHVVFQWGHMPLTKADQYLEMIIYFVMGGVTGVLSQKEALRREELRLANVRIEEAYSRLREQSLTLSRAEQHLRRADRLAVIGELSASMAHEIRNPLGSIKGTAEIFRDGLGRGHRLNEFAQILVREADRLDDILGRFLGFARPKDLERCQAQLAPAVEDVMKLMGDRARRAGIELVTDVSPGLPSMAVTADALRQVLLNLVLNGIEAVGSGGRIVVTARAGPAVRLRQSDPLPPPPVVHFAVADDGPGVPPEIRDRIFDPFFTTKRGGTGLGLAICQRIVHGYRGIIGVESASPKGARFLVELPTPSGQECPA